MQSASQLVHGAQLGDLTTATTQLAAAAEHTYPPMSAPLVHGKQLFVAQISPNGINS